MISDNGRNFVWEERELKELVAQLDQDKIVQSAAIREWSGASTPLWSLILVEFTKLCFTGGRICYRRGADGRFYGTRFTSELQALDVSISEHLRRLTTYSKSVDSSQFRLTKRWRRVQEPVRHFWNRWLREWLPTLNRRSKWQKEQKDIQVNDVVLVLAPDTPRGQWSLCRVLEIYPGADGHVRAEKVQSCRNVLMRPITRICLLESVVEKTAAH